MLNRGINLIVVMLLTCVLASCGTQPSQGERDSSTGSSAAEIQPLLEQARASTSPERERLILQAADLLVSQQDYDWARTLLTGLDPATLTDDAYVTYVDLLSSIALEEGSYFLAQGILTNPRLEQQWQNLDPLMEIQLRQKRAQVFALLGDIPTSVSERIQLTALITNDEEALANQEAIWRSLMTMSQNELQERSRNEPGEVLRGWYNLAALSKNNQGNLERQQAQVDAWRAAWPQHPASQNLPDDLKLLRTLIENQPHKIALLLPFEGRLAKAGEAVRDGFLAAYYQAHKEQRQTPIVRQYDSSGDIILAYEQAVAEGANLVIGPLDKEKVAELSLMPKLAVPVLTLNYLDVQPTEPTPGLYPLGWPPQVNWLRFAGRPV